MTHEEASTKGIAVNGEAEGTYMFFEGVMTSGFPTASAASAAQASIVSADYAGSFRAGRPWTTQNLSANYGNPGG